MFNQTHKTKVYGIDNDRIWDVECIVTFFSVCVVSPVITTEPAENTTVIAPESVMLSCSSMGVPEPTIQWIKIDEEMNTVLTNTAGKYQIVASNNTTEGEITSNLTILVTNASDTAIYQCKSSNLVGSAVENASIQVLGEPIETVHLC